MSAGLTGLWEVQTVPSALSLFAPLVRPAGQCWGHSRARDWTATFQAPLYTARERTALGSSAWGLASGSGDSISDPSNVSDLRGDPGLVSGPWLSFSTLGGRALDLMAAILFPQSDLLDVNQIIKDLASMVSEQGEAIGGYPCRPPSRLPVPPGVGPRQGLGRFGGVGICCIPSPPAQVAPSPSGRPGLRSFTQEGGPPVLLMEEPWPACPRHPHSGPSSPARDSSGGGQTVLGGGWAAAGPPAETAGGV